MSSIKYTSLSLKDIGVFKEMFSTFQDLILAMINNSVKVLQSSELVFKPNLKAHLGIVKRFPELECKYEEFFDIKDVFLLCIANKLCRKNLDFAISHFTIDDKHRIRFSIQKRFYSCLDDSSRLSFNKDIEVLERIINSISINFNMCLPLALQNGRLLSCKVRNVDIPKGARYVQLTKKE